MHFALTEPGAGFTRGMQCAAREDGDDWIVMAQSISSAMPISQIS